MGTSNNQYVRGYIGLGRRGPRGLSAYEIAVAHGFVGTEDEWLASLNISVTGDEYYTEDEIDALVNKVKYDANDLSAGYLTNKIIAGTGISLSEGTGSDADKLKITSTAVGTDEKVKYDAGDATAGYFSDKLVAGTGVSIAEGTAGNENKSIITNSDTGSSAVSAHNIAFNHGNIHASGSDNETATSIINLGIDEIEFALINSYMI